jgi:hypothetical protein
MTRLDDGMLDILENVIVSVLGELVRRVSGGQSHFFF